MTEQKDQEQKQEASPLMLSIEDFNASKKCEMGFEFPFIDEFGNETDWLITVIGDQAPAVKKAIYDKINRERRQIEMLKKRGKDEPFKGIEEFVGANIEGIAACIIGWRGVKEPYNPDLAIKVCENNKAVADQVKAAAENLANFTKSK